jgi:hypothetical protein
VRDLIVLASALAACGTDWSPPPPVARALPMRARVLTDAQYANAVHDLLGDGVVVPAFQTPGTTPHALIQDDLLAVDPIVLVQYRIAAQAIARDPALACSELGCARTFATRAFRRPLDAGEEGAIATMFAQGGFALVVEAALQAPAFLYRSELGGAPDDHGLAALTPHEVASELSFLFYDSIPDDTLRARADDGSLADPTVLAREVDRLLASPRVRQHLDDVMLDWLQVRNVYLAQKDPAVFPDWDFELADSMFGETAAFVDDVLWKRGGSLRELLVSTSSFANARLAQHYGLKHVTSTTFVPVHHDAKQRAGVLTHASVLAMLASPERESIIYRGMYVHRNFLCTPEMGRPPFASIAAVSDFTGQLSESQFSYYRQQNTYCGACHHTVDPPGRLLEQFDAMGRWRTSDENGIPVESWARLTIEGKPFDLDGAISLAHTLADSDRVALCVADQMTHHAFGRTLDSVALVELANDFIANDRDLVSLFRAIALSPSFRVRGGDVSQ